MYIMYIYNMINMYLVVCCVPPDYLTALVCPHLPAVLVSAMTEG